MFFFRRGHRFRTRSSMDSSSRKCLSSLWSLRLPRIRLYDSLPGKACIARVMYVSLKYMSHGLIYAYWTMNIKT